MTEIEQAVQALAVSELHVGTVTPETRLEDLGLDSLKLLRFVALLEKRFAIELPDEVIFDLETVHELATVIAKKLA